MSKRNQPRAEGQCACCGQHRILTVEHVIPRCLFDGVLGGVPGDVPKINICQQCNSAKSVDDAFLRDVLVRDVRVAKHPIAQGIRHGAHERSIINRKSQYPRAASRLQSVPSPTGSGLWLAEPILPKDRLHSIFARLVWELMVVYEQHELSSTMNFDVLRAVDAKVAFEEAQRWAVDAGGSGMVHTVQVGDGSVFWCVYYHSLTPGHADLSQWWLRFYEHIVYWVGTDMSNLALSVF